MPSTPKPSLILAVALLVAAASAAAAHPWYLSSTPRIPLGEVRGRIDHLAIDLARQRLFVAELGNGSLGIVDLARGAVLKRIGGLAEPQGVAYLPATDTIYVASGGDGSLRRFKGDDLAPLGVTELGDDADNVRVDARNGRIVVGYGDGALALIEPGSGDVDRQDPARGPPGVVSARGGREPDLRRMSRRTAGRGGRPRCWAASCYLEAQRSRQCSEGAVRGPRQFPDGRCLRSNMQASYSPAMTPLRNGQCSRTMPKGRSSPEYRLRTLADLVAGGHSNAPAKERAAEAAQIAETGRNLLAAGMARLPASGCVGRHKGTGEPLAATRPCW